MMSPASKPDTIMDMWRPLPPATLAMLTPSSPYRSNSSLTNFDGDAIGASSYQPHYSCSSFQATVPQLALILSSINCMRLLPPPGTPKDTGDSSCNLGRDGSPIQNPRPIQRIRLQQGENTRGVLRNVPLPVVNGGVFCKRWHLGMTCFSGCPRARSHVHPPLATVDTVASHLGVERAAAVAAGSA